MLAVKEFWEELRTNVSITLILKVIVFKSSRIIWINTNTGTTMKE
jgi:hypothetical protein